MYIDSHAHLTGSEAHEDVQGIIQRAQQVGVSHILNICTHPSEFKRGKQLELQYPMIRNAAATTPHDAEKETESSFALFAQAAQQKEIVAIGETGLDYHYFKESKQIQKQVLVRYLHLAASLKMPVIFHCRDAFLDLFSITALEYPNKAPAIVHCFTGNREEAEQALQKGWYLSFSGIITFKKSQVLREIVSQVPLSQLLIETDSPYLAPQSRRGEKNEPSFISETALCIAQIKQIPIEQIAQATSENAKKLFFLSC